MAEATETGRGRWLLLIHQLPKEPAYLRVKIGRRLAGVGAVALKNSVYVLPRGEETAEDFQWVRREIVASRGEATVAEAQLVEGLTDAEVEAKFREARDSDYEALIRDARALGAPSPRTRKRVRSDGARAGLLAGVVRLERRLDEIAAIDFFGGKRRGAASTLLRELRARAEPPAPAADRSPAASRVRGRTWVTRSGIHVDRIASAWLIKRFVDPGATFRFVPAKGYVPKKGELRFDMFDAEYSHEGDRCTFETLLARFDLRQPGLRAVGEVVHDIDLKDEKFARPETAGLAACIAGLCRACGEDDRRLADGSMIFESLLAHFATKKEARA